MEDVEWNIQLFIKSFIKSAYDNIKVYVYFDVSGFLYLFYYIVKEIYQHIVI